MLRWFYLIGTILILLGALLPVIGIADSAVVWGLIAIGGVCFGIAAAAPYLKKPEGE
jgi:hypothetical protein